MQNYITYGRLQVAEQLDAFINQHALPDTGVSPTSFWQGAENLFATFIPQNRALLEKREQLQHKIDEYHKAGNPVSGQAYPQFLKDIGYLVEQPADVNADTTNVFNADLQNACGVSIYRKQNVDTTNVFQW